MRLPELRKINKLYFGYEEIARALGIKQSSARVSACRYVEQGLLLRLKKNMYILPETLDRVGREEKFTLANIGQAPSYISLMTALDYYGITTQMQRDIVESIALKRTREMAVNDLVFRYNKIQKDLYFGFIKKENVFIATPEKSLLDAFYLMSFGRYALDLAALNREKLDPLELERLSRKFPERTRNLLKKHGYFASA